MKNLTSLAAIVFVVVSVTTFADVVQWIGVGATASWTNAANWAGGVVPGRYTGPDGNEAGITGGNVEFSVGEVDQTIDLDGLLSVTNISVGGTGNGRLRFGTSDAQTLTLEEGGLFTVAASIQKAPILVAGLGQYGTGSSATDSTLTNDSADPIVFQGGIGRRFGYDGSWKAVRFTFGGSGGYTLAGPMPLVKLGCSCVTSHQHQKPFVIAHADVSFHMITIAKAGDPCTIYVNRDCACKLAGGSGNGLSARDADQKNSVVITGEGSFLFPAGNKAVNGVNYLENGFTQSGYDKSPVIISTAIVDGWSTASKSNKGVGLRTSSSNAAPGGWNTGLLRIDSPDCRLNGDVEAYSTMGLQIGSFGLKGEQGSLGYCTNFYLCNGARLVYMGAGEMTDRNLHIGRNANSTITALSTYYSPDFSLEQAGTGPLTVSSTLDVVEADLKGLTPTVTLINNTAQSAVWSGDLTVEGLSVVKTGKGPWTLTGANAYTGATRLEAGTLELGAGGSIASSSGLTMSHGTMLAVTAAGEKSIRALTFGGGDTTVALADGARLTVGSALARVNGLLSVTQGSGSALVCPDMAGQSPNWLTLNGHAAKFDAGGVLTADLAPNVIYSVGATVTNDEVSVFHPGATLTVENLSRLTASDQFSVLAEFPYGYVGTPILAPDCILPDGWELVQTATQILLCNTAYEYTFEFPAGGELNKSFYFDFPVKMSLAHEEGFEFDFYSSNDAYWGIWGVLTCVLGGSANGNWYDGSFQAESNEGWNHVVARKASITSTEKEPNGWADTVKVRMRMSRRPSTEAVTFKIRNVRPIAGPRTPAAAIVFHEDCAVRNSNGGNSSLAIDNLNVLDAGFAELGMPRYMLSDRDLENLPIPETTKLVFYMSGGYPDAGNNYDKGQPPDSLVAHLRDFLERGGTIVFFGINSAVTKLTKLMTDYPDRAVRFSDRTIYSSETGTTAEKLLPYVKDLPGAAEVMAEETARRKSKQKAADDWTAAQTSRVDDIRSVYCHVPDLKNSAFMDWNSAAEAVKKAGLTRMIVCVCRGEYAAYPSDVLRRWPGLENRNCLAECLTACRKWGLELFAWRCCWTTPDNLATEELKQILSDEGRDAITSAGAHQSIGGCPTHPDNVATEIASMVELAKTGVDGINFDYIRYENANVCYCDRCRAKFEEFLGEQVVNWPQDACSGGRYFDNKWMEFRCGNISHVVEEVARQVRAECPKVKISVSGFKTETALLDVAQDWAYWARQGWIDEIDPMCYWDTAANFTGNVSSLLRRDIGKAVFCPLIGNSLWTDQGDDTRRTTEQIQVARDLGCTGYGFFEFDERFARMLPMLKAGPLHTQSGLPIPESGVMIIFH